mmetsp:Transcript_28463/g.71491  ORF Transcript_28463/g.71491 Transcript_28463/m.71491 type:complete len:226 (+) Transcript_28463:469-1146(+)
MTSCPSSSSRVSVTAKLTLSPSRTLSDSTSACRSTLGYALHTAATSRSCASLICSRPVRRSSVSSSRSKMSCTPASRQRAMTASVKCGSCLRCESEFHCACTTIWHISMAATAGLSQPCELMTSTMACSRRMHSCRTAAWSEARSEEMGLRAKWHCSSTLALVCGSLYFGWSIFSGMWRPSFCSCPLSRRRMGMRSYSDALQRICMRPFSRVLAVRDELNSSTVV